MKIIAWRDDHSVFDTGNSENYYRYKETISSKEGHIISEVIYYPNGKVRMEISNEYNSDGKLVRHSELNNEEETNEINKFYYDEKQIQSPYKNPIPIVKLQPGQEITFSAITKLGTEYEDAMFSAACIAAYKQIKDDSLEGTLLDPRLGPMEKGVLCPTCSHDYSKCVGHFGYIHLPCPIINPLFYQNIIKVANMFCFKCSKFLFHSDSIEYKGILSRRGFSRYNYIINLNQKQYCPYCKVNQYKYSKDKDRDGPLQISKKIILKSSGM